MFIGTNNKIIATKLKHQGYREFKNFNNQGVFLFLDNEKINLNFSNEERKEIFFTNKLHF